MCINDLCDILNKASVLDRVLLYNRLERQMLIVGCVERV